MTEDDDSALNLVAFGIPVGTQEAEPKSMTGSMLLAAIAAVVVILLLLLFTL